MFIPEIKTNAGRAYMTQFQGLNRQERSEANELSDCMNVTSDAYPCIASVKIPEKVISQADIQAVIAPKYSTEEITSFTGVSGGRFYYKGEAIPFESSDMSLSGEVQLADFNGTIIMCPSMYYFSYVPDTDSGNIIKKVRKMEKGVYEQTATVRGKEIEDDNGNVTDYENYISISGVDFEDYFSSGDSVFIEGFSDEKNNSLYIDSKYETADDDRIMSAVVSKVKGSKLYLRLYNRKGKQIIFTDASGESGISVYIKIPTMNCVTVHNNRLWGTNPNGEQVYASKIGDPFNFFTFSGLASDSWYSEVGTAGDFIGIVSYRDNVIAFKRDYIHHIYGDKPINFNIPKQLSDCGCIDIRSAVEVGTVLYYLGYNGFYAYAGGQPLIISDKLAKSYKSACAWTDGIKYYVSATDTDGSAELLVYDTRYNIWLRQGDIQAVGYFRWHNETYAASSDSVYNISRGEYGEWSVTTSRIDEGIVDKKGAFDIFVYAELDEGSEMTVSVKTDGGFWRECRRVQYSGLKAVRIPVRFVQGDYYKIKISGKGKAVIHGLERAAATGGRRYGVYI